MKLDQQELEQLESVISNLKSKNKSDDIDIIEDFLDIIRDNLSENYKFLGTDCYEKNGIYRFQAFVDGKNKEVILGMVRFLGYYPDLIGNNISKNISVSYRGGFRIVLTMDLIAG